MPIDIPGNSGTFPGLNNGLDFIKNQADSFGTKAQNFADKFMKQVMDSLSSNMPNPQPTPSPCGGGGGDGGDPNSYSVPGGGGSPGGGSSSGPRLQQK
ncbi:hypothetical protein [Paraburkholderia rhizosphaerae]|uniref:Uncharacterized protein n=1 Tax=Paraburkholderia rhizosphaerae TaxID=480658 RepID=A0A4R8LK93_9BURK|nr:hypothetical protein [Paraburkholderia rhizosphaerae]TDY42760.1 hypothetical protein BX592_120124 [Paraburkholderia rhizosphaerae]